jgi:hypothetical protein
VKGSLTSRIPHILDVNDLNKDESEERKLPLSQRALESIDSRTFSSTGKRKIETLVVGRASLERRDGNV